MSPLAIAALLFGVTALGGAYMVWLMARGRPFPAVPLPLVHGLLAAVALLTLWGVVANRLGNGTARIALVTLVATALLGLLLARDSFRDRMPPWRTVVVHALLAVGGIVLLLVALR